MGTRRRATSPASCTNGNHSRWSSITESGAGIEGNSAFRHLTQYDHFRVWQRRWGAAVILHQTQRNKWDEQTGVEALLPPLYRQGLKLPHRPGDLDALGFVTKFTKELTEYPDSATKDLVMADWQAEWNMARTLAAGRRAIAVPIADANLPPYLQGRQHENRAREGSPVTTFSKSSTTLTT